MQTRMYKPLGKHEKAGPAFLRQEVASKLISGSSYNKAESFEKTQVPAARFFIAKGRTNSMLDQAIRKAKLTPGAGHYDIDKIEKGYKATTLGASRGWK